MGATNPDRTRCGYLIQRGDSIFTGRPSYCRVSKDGLSRIIGAGLLEDIDADTDEAFVQVMTALLQPEKEGE